MKYLDRVNIRETLDAIQPGRCSIGICLDLSSGLSTSDLLECSLLFRCIPQKRIACLGRWRGRQVFVKIFLNQRRSGIHVAREKRGCEMLRAASVATPALLYHTKLESTGIQVLLFEYVQDGTNGEAYWDATLSRDKKLVLLQLVSLLAGHHKAGIVQQDLHLDNFLFARGMIYTLDAASVIAIQQAPASEQRLGNLALLLAQFQPEYDRWVDDAFSLYLRIQGTEAESGDRVFLQKALSRWRRQRKSVELAKIFRSCTGYVCSRSWHKIAVIGRNYDTPGLRGLLSNLDAGMENGIFIKRGNTSTVARVEVDGRELIVKRYNMKNWRHGLNRAFRASRAAVSWRNAHRLRFYGVDSPKPVALVENRWGPLRRKAYFITEPFEGMDCLQYFETHDIDQDQVRQTAKNIGRILKRLEACRISHGDMKGTNILVEDKNVVLVDLDAMREHWCEWFARRRIARDRRRFMRNWCGNAKLSALFVDYLETPQGSDV